MGRTLKLCVCFGRQQAIHHPKCHWIISRVKPVQSGDSDSTGILDHWSKQAAIVSNRNETCNRKSPCCRITYVMMTIEDLDKSDSSQFNFKYISYTLDECIWQTPSSKESYWPFKYVIHFTLRVGIAWSLTNRFRIDSYFLRSRFDSESILDVLISIFRFKMSSRHVCAQSQTCVGFFS